jgi:chloramphenicol O-acetyltransferase
MYKEVDIQNWKRAVHCQVFRNSVQPHYCVSFELDITNFLPQIKSRKCSFTLALVYAVSRCANEIEEFRYRFVDGKVVLFDRINTAFTYLDKDTELFKVVNVEMQETLEEYLAVAGATARNQKNTSRVRWEMTCFSFRRCHGFLLRIFRTLILAKKIMQPLYLIGESSSKEMEGRFCHFPCRYTIPLWMVSISGN